jgi:hypothetical protein
MIDIAVPTIGRTLGAHGTVNGGVLQYGFPRGGTAITKSCTGRMAL